jgi:hypothetical protein
MLTDTQIDFVHKVEKRFDEFDTAELSNSFFVQIFKAIALEDDMEVARICGMMILELAQKEFPIADLAEQWTELFGPMFLQRV